MMRRKRIAFATACVAAILVTAGCGGVSAGSDYAEADSAVTAKIEREAATQLPAIEPADDATAGHADAQAGVAALAADVQRPASALAERSSPAATVGTPHEIATSRGPAPIQAGEQQLRQAGFEVR